MRILGIFILLGFALFLGWNNGFPLLFRASFLLLFGMVLGWFWVWGHLRGLEGRLEAPVQRVAQGQGVEVKIELLNRSLIPKPWLEVRLPSDLPQAPGSQVVALAGQRDRTWSFFLPCPRRGHFFLGPLTLASRDPFGLFHRELTLGSPLDLIVYPAPVPLSPALKAVVGRGGDSPWAAPLGLTPPVRGVREYFPGDSFSLIHWPSSAHMARLMSKEMERESAQDVWLLLDLEARAQAGEGAESTEEYGVAVAASLAKLFLEANRAVGLAAWGQHLHLVPPGKGPAQLWELLETLALARAQGAEPLPRLMGQVAPRCHGGSTLVLITPAPPDSWAPFLGPVLQGGSRGLVFLLEASTFDPARPPAPGVSWAGVGSYRIKRGRLWELSLLTG